MTNDTRRIIRDGFGAIEDELRQRRAVDSEILKRLDMLIKLAGGDSAKIQSIQEDISQLQESRSEHERKLAAHSRELAAIAR